nr:ATP-binding protein [uncultured Desulfobacter sp.]
MPWKTKLQGGNLPAILILFLFLTLLFFITAVMDVYRTKSLLLSMAESGGKAVLESLEAVVRERYDDLSPKSRSFVDPLGDFTDIENQFRAKEKVIERLIDSAKKLDRSFKADPPPNAVLKQLANRFFVTGIFFLDPGGRILSGSRSLSGVEKDGLDKLSFEQNDVHIELELNDPDVSKTHWVGIHREKGAELIFLMLNQRDLDLFLLRLVCQEVIQEVGRQKGLFYLFVTDGNERVIAGFGENNINKAFRTVQSENPLNLTEPDFSGPHRLSRDLPVMEVRLAMTTGGDSGFEGVAGVDITQVRQTAQRNMIHVFVFTGIIICSAGIVLLFVYRIQRRHNDRVQDLNRQLAQAQRLSSLGKLAAGVAHEIRNPLNAVSMAVQRIYREFKPDTDKDKKVFSQLVSIVRDEIDRLNRIIETFIEPARIKPEKFKPFPLSDFLVPVLSLARETASPKGIKIIFNAPEPSLIVSMDEPRFRQAVWNLLKNAMESIPGKGEISVSASGAEDGHAQILISDTGTGIDSDTLKRVLEFEYTTKDKGLGVGLPIAYEIILAHGGQLKINSTKGVGTTARIVLPLHGKSDLKEAMA